MFQHNNIQQCHYVQIVFLASFSTETRAILKTTTIQQQQRCCMLPYQQIAWLQQINQCFYNTNFRLYLLCPIQQQVPFGNTSANLLFPQQQKILLNKHDEFYAR
eukprot:TRINITY_DN27063_c0_g1_i4.p6 TRINITY_DN27063_c0_g1~~TRINITY_DN27063_c0_g1_i4.p6  ORF type:complete len:104 (+),score=0.31 TRINITY_DN27063_c0_g1_i4:1270-1581(+)